MEQKTNEQWEYLTHTVVSIHVKCSVLNFEHAEAWCKATADELSRLGEQGWEAYTATKSKNGTTYYLKRRKGGAR